MAKNRSPLQVSPEFKKRLDEIQRKIMMAQGQKRSLREMINISQATNNQMPMQSNMMGGESQQFKQRGLLNPLRYIKPQAQN